MRAAGFRTLYRVVILVIGILCLVEGVGTYAVAIPITQYYFPGANVVPAKLYVLGMWLGSVICVLESWLLVAFNCVGRMKD